VAGHLLVEVVGAEDAELGRGSPGGLMGGGTSLEVLRDEPTVAIDSLHDAGAAQRFEPPDVRADIGVIISTWDTDLAVLGERPMLARTINPAAASDLSNVMVGRPLGTGAADLDHGADRCLLGS